MPKKNVVVSPSLFAADFGHLSEEAKRIEQCGADALHFDIMDGHFVPNLTLGPKALAAVRKSCSLFLDVHIMVYNPYDFVEKLIENGADRITFHVEATESVEDTISYIKTCNKQVGIALKPQTSFSLVERYLEHIDLVLMMTVNPGFGGQAFMPEVLDKIEICDQYLRENNLSTSIQVDGGINYETGRKCLLAGATNLVAGSFLFSLPDLKEGIRKLRECGKG